MTALVVVEALVIGLLALLVAGLLRSHAEILRALHDLGIGEHGVDTSLRSGPSVRDTPPPVRDEVVAPGPGGTAVHDIVGALPSGGQRTVSIAGASHPTLLAFLSSSCATCGAFWHAFGADAIELPGADTRLVIVTKGPEAESPTQVRDLAPPGVTTVMASDAWESYRVPGSPYFVLVDGVAGAVIGEGSAMSWDQVSALLQSAIADAGWTSDVRQREARRATGRVREERVDGELLAAGIPPGDPSLYPTSLPQVDEG
jgi:hypothetical protein